MSDQIPDFDVAIIGGGPAGTTVATLLKKYNPGLSVLILEKEKFPREHVGESQLPLVSHILAEMGVWEKVEAANFPIKLGVSYTWGQIDEPWEFDFFPAEEFADEPRPASYAGQRQHTAFQVERAEYDNILLRHAEEMGAEVREETSVKEVLREDDTITGLKLSTGNTVTARHYVDASGHVGLLRRAMGVESEAPKELRNVAFWDYWDNAKWKVEIGVGGTRVYVRSLPFGWIWFIPLGPSRASVGLICPSDYYKERGVSPRELYDEALDLQPDIKALLSDAKCELGDDKVHSIKNWSHLSSRLAGDNWWLCGESAGFADPILAAGMTLAHSSARETAYSILDIENDSSGEKWVKNRYDTKNRDNINQHIRFAKYWYASNGQFTDLQDHCTSIAKEAGLKLSPKDAWRWLSQGGFATEFSGTASLGSFSLNSGRHLVDRFLGGEQKMKIAGHNVFKLNIRGAKEDVIGDLHDGVIVRVPCYRRGNAVLPLAGQYGELVEMLKQTSDIDKILAYLNSKISGGVAAGSESLTISAYMQTLDAMMIQGWVTAKLDTRKPQIQIGSITGRLIRSEEDAKDALTKAKGSIKFN
jgi:flavin-dependent dehydrogenase